MAQLLTSAAPHVHSGDTVQKNMLFVILALLPAFAVSIIAFGWSALITAAICIAACVLTEWCISKYMLGQQPSITDLSAVLTGLLLAMNLPSNLPWWMALIGCIFAIGVGKMAFGGIGQNLFNPALVGRVFLLISFPAAMTTWPVAKGFATSYLDAETGATPLYYLKHITKTGDVSFVDQLPAIKDAFLGMIGGSLGEVCALALILGGIFLICTRVISWHIPVSIIATVALLAWIATPEGMGAHEFIAYQLCSGGLMLGAIFMATDYVTSPMTAWGKIIYGVAIGVVVMVIRLWGSYPEGMSFAILIMNAVVPLLDRIAPKRFGEVAKK